jgi:hypothetical protein
MAIAARAAPIEDAQMRWNPWRARRTNAICNPKGVAMLQVTPAASEYLNTMLDRVKAPSEAAVRIVSKPDGGGLTTTIDEERDGDQHFDCKGRTVLVLDSQVATALSEQTLDVEKESQRLVLA